MALTRSENQVKWAAADSKSVASGGALEASDIITLDDTCVEASATVKADNSGTPAAGDIISVFLVSSSGDPDGAGADEYSSEDTKHMLLLCTLDTNVSDPAIQQVNIPNVPKKHKIVAINDAVSNSITFSVAIEELKSA